MGTEVVKVGTSAAPREVLRFVNEKAMPATTHELGSAEPAGRVRNGENGGVQGRILPMHGGLKRPLPGRPGPGSESVVMLLQAVQERCGYLPAGEVARAAAHAGVSLAQAYGVATFYNFFRLQPPGVHTIRICRGTACHVRGSGTLLDHIQTTLGIGPGETTRDGLFSLETVACLGCCSRAPAVVVDGVVHGRVTRQELNRLVQRLRRRERVEART